MSAKCKLSDKLKRPNPKMDLALIFHIFNRCEINKSLAKISFIKLYSLLNQIHRTQTFSMRFFFQTQKVFELPKINASILTFFFAFI